MEKEKKMAKLQGQVAEAHHGAARLCCKDMQAAHLRLMIGATGAELASGMYEEDGTIKDEGKWDFK
jgi:hypothetical protein